MKSNLLCTFTHKYNLESTLKSIEFLYNFDSKIIFILQNKLKQHEFICTYNVVGNYELSPNTILIHRKSETNTLYTINAINQIIMKINNGILDKNIEIPWNLYTNSLILMKKSEVNIIPLEFQKIYNIK